MLKKKKNSYENSSKLFQRLCGKNNFLNDNKMDIFYSLIYLTYSNVLNVVQFEVLVS